MKAKIMGRTIEIPDERVRGGVAITTTGQGVRIKTEAKAPIDLCASMPRASAGTGVAENTKAPSPPGWPAKKDKWNYAYAQFLELERQAGRIVCWWYEPSSYWLPGQVRYKPDFLVWYPDKLEYVEVKGWSRNLRDGITRYKIAASLWPCFSWKMVKRKGHGWEEYT